MGGEAYEGTIVQLSDVEIMTEPSNYGEMDIDDGTGITELDDSFHDVSLLQEAFPAGLKGVTLQKLVGVVDFTYEVFEVHPTGPVDLTYTFAPTVAPTTFTTEGKIKVIEVDTSARMTGITA